MVGKKYRGAKRYSAHPVRRDTSSQCRSTTVIDEYRQFLIRYNNDPTGCKLI